MRGKTRDPELPACTPYSRSLYRVVLQKLSLKELSLKIIELSYSADEETTTLKRLKTFQLFAGKEFK